MLPIAPVSRPAARAPRRAHAGLTLVEAVTGLLVVGILAAVALPRYADVQAKARETRIKALAQSLRVVVGAAHRQAEAQGISCAATVDAQLRIDDATLPLRHCYPRALADVHGGLLSAAGLQPGEAWVARGLVQAPAGTVGELLVQASDAPDPARCAVRYVEAPRAGDAAEISWLLTGC